MSTSVGVRELKNGLSRYLRLAHDGESIVVCDRGEPVAILSPLPGGGKAATTMAEHLASLAARGLLTLPSRKKRSRAPRRLPKVDLSSAVIEDREDRA
jgi:prevent-host-death family protein